MNRSQTVVRALFVIAFLVAGVGSTQSGYAQDVPEGTGLSESISATGARAGIALGLFEPVSLVADDASIQVSLVGTYRGGLFANKSLSKPVYDEHTKRLLVPTQTRQALEVLDISDPSNPTLVQAIDLTAFGGEVENAAIHRGVVGVVVQDITGVSTISNILLMNVEGQLLADAIPVETASGIAFTPWGFKLVVSQSGKWFGMGGVTAISLGFPNWRQCRLGNVERCRIRPTVNTIDFSAYDGREQELIDMGVRLPLSDYPASVNLKTSDLAMSTFGRYAHVTLQANNAIASFDLSTMEVATLSPLGVRDCSLPGNGFDASDKDGAINIRPWPVQGMYMPDGHDVTGWGPNTLIYTTNEGDLIDEDFFSEELKVEKATLDPTVFPDGDMLKERENLGRLKVSSVGADTDGDGDVDRLLMGGTRSFSIWNRDGEQIFDSGDDFEQITAQAVPKCFNCSGDENDFDGRSRKKGPEPEYIEVERIGSKRYAFIGLERIGGVMIYDVTNPHAPVFQQYFNNRNFSVDPRDVCGEKGEPAPPDCALAGDLEVEGVMVIPGYESPIGVPLLVLVHEGSDSTTILRINKVR